MTKKCCALNKGDGNRCENPAAINGLCITHYRIENFQGEHLGRVTL